MSGGNDTLYGGQDNDLLFNAVTGSGDSDRLFGNLGDDTFDFASIQRSQYSGTTDANSNRIDGLCHGRRQS